MSGSIESSVASAPRNMLWSSASTTRIFCVKRYPPLPQIVLLMAAVTQSPAAGLSQGWFLQSAKLSALWLQSWIEAALASHVGHYLHESRRPDHCPQS